MEVEFEIFSLGALSPGGGALTHFSRGENGGESV